MLVALLAVAARLVPFLLLCDGILGFIVIYFGQSLFYVIRYEFETTPVKLVHQRHDGTENILIFLLLLRQSFLNYFFVVACAFLSGWRILLCLKPRP